MNRASTNRISDVNGARLGVYRWLSRALLDPTDDGGKALHSPAFQDETRRCAAIIRARQDRQKFGRAPGEISVDFLNPERMIAFLQTARFKLVREFGNVFGFVMSKECPPYETEYCPQTFSVYRAHQLADIAGYYRAFGLEPARIRPERHDHVALELEFMAWLIAKEEYAWTAHIDLPLAKADVCRDAQRSFCGDHLAWWIPAFAFALRKKADGLSDESELESDPKSFFGAVGQLLAAFVSAERAFLDISPPKELLAPQARDEDPACADCHIQQE